MFYSDVDCGTLPGLEHGTVSLANSRTTYGAKAVYSCHENYTLIGHEKRTCGTEGKWTDTNPQCLFDWCPDPQQYMAVLFPHLVIELEIPLHTHASSALYCLGKQ